MRVAAASTAAAAASAGDASPAASPSRGDGRIKASPLAKKMASEAGLLPEQTSDVKALMESTLSALSISPVSRVVLFRKRPALPERVPPAPGYRLEGLAGKLQALGGGGIVLREFERELDSLAAPAAEE